MSRIQNHPPGADDGGDVTILPQAAAPAPDLVLSGHDAADKPLRLSLAGRTLTAGHGIVLGREGTITHIAVDDDHTSKRHVRIGYKQDALFVEDLHSLNGTFLNGERLPPFVRTPLAVGDRLKLGGVRLTVEKP